MAVIKNTFSGKLDNVTIKSHTITGLTSATSTTSVSNMCPEISLHFLRNLYQTLLDAGYSDTTINESEYSITILDVKFFCLANSWSSSSYGLQLIIYACGVSNHITAKNTSSADDIKAHSISNSSNNVELEYNITVRGDKNCVCISYGTYQYPNATNPLIFIAKAKNIITSEDMRFFTGFLDGNTAEAAYYCTKYFRKTLDIYNTYAIYDYNDSYERRGAFTTAYTQVSAKQTPSKFVVEPVLADNGTILIPSMIMCNTINFVKGTYYKIGSSLYYCNGYKRGRNTTYGGQYALYKVSDD